jgi:hypothetical protein
MDDQIPWTGDMSNRQILMDTARGVTVWAAVSISLFVLAWLATNNLHFANPNWRAPLCAALAVVIGSPIARWCRAKGPQG